MMAHLTAFAHGTRSREGRLHAGKTQTAYPAPRVPLVDDERHLPDEPRDLHG